MAETATMSGPTPSAAAQSRWFDRFMRLPSRWEILALVGLLVVTRLMPRPVPLGVYGIGVVAGARLALQGVALVLVYRSNRVINFAQAAYGLSAALLFSALVQYRPLLRLIEPLCTSDCTANPSLVQVNYWLSLLLTLGFVIGLGWATHFVVIRRFANAPRLLLTVATIFVGYTVTGITGQIVSVLTPPEASERGAPLGAQPATLPFSFAYRMGLVTFNAVDFVTIGVAVAVVSALVLYLRRSAAGTAIRAAADNPDRAASLGVNVETLTGRVWMLSAGLAATAGVLGAMAEGAANSGGGFGSEVRILAAGVVAHMVSLPMVAAASVVLSILQQAMQWNDKAVLLDALLFVIIGGLLLLQARGQSRAEHAAAGEWRAAREIRPIPRELRNLPTVRSWTRGGIGLLVAVLAIYPWAVEPGRTNLASLVMIYAIIGLSLLVLTGWAGQISLGQVGFAAVGAYVAAASGVPFLLAAPLGMFAGALAALLIGIPALRLRGLHLAVMTLAFHQAVITLALSPGRYLGVHLPAKLTRPSLLGMRLDDQRTFYYFTLLVLAAVAMAVLGMRRSRTARALLATRDNELAAQSFGINLTRARVGAFVVSGALCALAGVLLAYHQGGVQAGAFDLGLSRLLFLYSVIGGLGSVAGPLIGLAYYGLPLLAQLPGLVPLLLSGPGGLALILATPGGIGQLLFDARDNWLRRLARRNRIVVPSLLADTASDDSPAPLAPKARPGGGVVFVPRRYHLPGQWAIDGVGAAPATDRPALDDPVEVTSLHGEVAERVH